MRPETQYAKSGDVHIAYQVLGNGRLDLVLVLGFVSHLEYAWEEPSFVRYLERLASFSRLILFDKRGTGMSDRVAVATLEERMDDVRAVMDAVGVERAALYGVSEGGPMSLLFAATYPRRVQALVLQGAFVKRLGSPDYPWGATQEERQAYLNEIEQQWAGNADLSIVSPSRAGDQRFRNWFTTYRRMAASPGAAQAIARMNTEIDVRHVVPAIRVPTLVIHSAGDRDVSVENGRYLARRLPSAKYIEIDSVDHFPMGSQAEVILDEIEEFLTGARHAPDPDRVLATVLFTDIVDSTERASTLGDQAWRDVLAEHHRIIRRELERFRGREVKTAGDGFLATFDGPARGIRCAQAVQAAVGPLGIAVRAGLHTGEVEVLGDDIGGIAVHIGARVAALAGPNEVVVSSTVKDLVAGSGITFVERGVHTLKGVPGEWRLFTAR